MDATFHGATMIAILAAGVDVTLRRGGNGLAALSIAARNTQDENVMSAIIEHVVDVNAAEAVSTYTPFMLPHLKQPGRLACLPRLVPTLRQRRPETATTHPFISLPL